jgi:hypothetical protein
MELLGESDSSVIIAHFTRLVSLLVRKCNTVVDVQDAVLAAGRPDSSRRLNAVLLGVDLAVQQRTAANSSHACSLCLAGVLGEVVCRNEVSGNAFVETSPAVVGGVYNCVLEASWVLKVEVQLAVLTAVGGGSAGADVRLELIEAVSNDLWLCELVFLLCLLSSALEVCSARGR